MFDRSDIDERSTFSVTSIILRIMEDVKRHNAESPEDIWFPPEHIWVRLYFECEINTSHDTFLNDTRHHQDMLVHVRIFPSLPG